MTQYAKSNEFDRQDSTQSAASPALQADDGVQDAAAGEDAQDLAGMATKGTDDLVAWASKTIEQNPGLVLAGAAAAGIAIAAMMMPRQRPVSQFARLQRDAIRYGDRLDRKARRELRRMRRSETYASATDLASTYGSQLSGIMASLASQAQQLIEQARRSR